MHIPRVILVGRISGRGQDHAGGRKTVRRLMRTGRRVGIVTNDQAPDLVDTGTLKVLSSDVGEVAGGCFCCHFNDFIGELKRVNKDLHADVLIGEPVGSCTDLSATVLQPLKKLYADAFQAAPFSVLVDPRRLRESLAPRGQRPFPDSVLYIYRLQIEEADAIVLNKVDTLSPAEVAELKAILAQRYPGRPVFAISAQTGQGVDEWLGFVLDTQPAGQRIAEVDYDVYAEGEAVLGWLNAAVPASRIGTDRLEAALPVPAE